MKDDDPFDDRVDPYLRPVSRRFVLTLAAAAPALTSCVAARVACVSPGEITEGACKARFCRYHVT